MQTVYDAPATLLGQMLDGEVGWRSFRSTFLEPEALSPLERYNARERLKEAAGNHAPTNILIDLATNPFVWAMFAFAPAGAKAVKEGRRIFGNTRSSELGKRYVGYVKDRKGLITTILDGLGFLSARQKTEDTPLGPVASAAALRNVERIAKWEGESGLAAANAAFLERTAKAFGLRELASMDPDLAPSRKATVGGRTWELKDYLREAVTVTWAKLSGVDREHVVQRPRIEKPWIVRATREVDGKVQTRNLVVNEDVAEAIRAEVGPANRAMAADEAVFRERGAARLKGFGLRDSEGNEWTTDSLPAPAPEGHEGKARVLAWAKGAQVGPKPVTFGSSEAVQKRLVTAPALDKAVETFGLGELIQAKRRALELSKRDLFLDEAGQVSETKLLRLWRWVSEGKALNPNAPVDEEELSRLSIVEGMFGRPMLDRVRRGELTQDEWMSGAKGMLKVQLDQSDWYFPRNTVAHLGVNGEFIPEEEVMALNRARKWTGGSMAQLRTDDELHLDPESLRRLRTYATDKEALRNVEEAEHRVRGAWLDAKGRGETLPVLEADANRGMYTYLRRAGRDHTLAVDDISPEEMRAWADLKPRQADMGEKPLPKFGGPLPKTGQGEWTEHELRPDASQWPTFVDAKGAERVTDRHMQMPAGGMARFDLLKSLVGKDGVVEPRSAELFREIVLPRMMGETPIKNLFLWDGIRKARGVARWIGESALVASLEAGGGPAASWAKSLREWGSSPTRLTEGQQLGGSVAKWLYASHLGFNPGSLILNMTQPFLHGAAWMGAGVTMKAWPRAMKAVAGYASERARLGRNIPKEERQRLFARHFDFGEAGHSTVGLLGITEDALDQLDGAVMSRMGRGTPGPVKWALTDLPLIPFQMSERLNRLTVAMGVEELYRGQHGPKAWSDPKVRSRMLGDMEAMVSRTQFGPGIMDQPELFLKHLDSPLLRMFLSFPVRAATATLETSQRIGARGPMGTATDMLRMLGISSVIYEVGKEAFGADLTRGLAAETIGGLVGGDRFVQDQNLAIGVPPAIDIAYGLVRGVSLGDAEALRSTIPRIVPGGVSGSRLLGTLPSLPVVGGLQKQTVDWGAMTEEGQVPVFAADGTLLKYAWPVDVTLRALGVDGGRWNDSAKLTRWLVANRERIVDYRRRYVQSVLAGEMSDAKGIASEYQTAYGVPLTVTQDQWRKAVQARERPSMERAFEMVPKDLRAGFARSMGTRGAQLGVPGMTPGDVAEGLSTPASTRFADRPSAYDSFVPPDGY